MPKPLRAAPTPPRPRFDYAVVIALALFGAAASILTYLAAADPQAHAATPVELRALGQVVPPSREPESVARELARSFLRAPITLSIGDIKRRVTRGALGMEVDLRSLEDLLRAAASEGSPLRRFHAQRRSWAPLELPVPARLDDARAERFVRELAEDLNSHPRPARVDPTSGLVLPPERGRSLDLDGALDVLADAAFRGLDAVSLPIRERTLPSSATEHERGPVDLGALLGSYETEHAPGDRTRAHNLEVAAQALHGTLLWPGETFDTLLLLGPLSMRPFLRSAFTSSEGDGLRGALEQLASTLHAAALFAGLPIVEQHPAHAPSGAIELGLDATLSPTDNLRFQNDTPHPIAILLAISEGRLRVSVRGARHDEREVDVERLIEEVMPYAELTRPDATLPRGTRVVAQRGTLGYRVVFARVVRAPEHEVARREERIAVYGPEPRVVRVGSGRPSTKSAPAPRDPRPELLIDEFVAMTMRPGFELPEETARREGRTGFESYADEREPDAAEPRRAD